MTRRIASRIVVATTLGFFTDGAMQRCQAQEPAAPPAAEAAASPIAAGPEKAAFDAAFEAYKTQVQALEGLRTEYQTANQARQGQINAELIGLHSQTRTLLENMVDTAVKAYQANPEADPKVTELLLLTAQHRIQGNGPSSQGGDDYEAALEVINVLIEGGNAKEELPMWGALAAAMTNDYDLAEKYFKTAQDAGLFSQAPDRNDPGAAEIQQLAMRAASTLPTYKEMWAEEKAIRDAEAAADDLPRVKLNTTEGDIVIELFENEAPQAVANFITLVKDGFYNDVKFHRVLPHFMAQGGDPTGTGSGGPGYNIPCECYGPEIRKHFRGTMSMAHAGRDTGGSQFFMTFVPTSHLDGKHTVFGRVYDGFEVLARLKRIEPGERGTVPSKIVKAEVIRDRGQDYSKQFKKLPGR